MPIMQNSSHAYAHLLFGVFYTYLAPPWIAYGEVIIFPSPSP